MTIALKVSLFPYEKIYEDQKMGQSVEFSPGRQASQDPDSGLKQSSVGKSSATKIIQHPNNNTVTGSNQPYLWYGEPPAQWLMALTSLGALFLSAMAVYLLSRTLRQGEDINNAAIAAANAANETNAIMRQEQRPWVVFERKIGCDFSVEGKTVTLKWNYRLLNKGKTPAFAVRVSTRIISEDGWQPSSSSLEDFFDMSFARAKSQKSSRTVFPASEGIEWTDFQTGTKIGDMKKEFYLLVMVNYRLWQTSEGDWGHDLRVFHIELNEGPDEEFSAYPYVLTEYSTLRHTG